MFIEELKHLWRWGKRLVVAVGVLLSFFAVMELLRAYQTLHNVHPWLGIGFAIVVIVGLLGLLFWLVKDIYRYPKVLVAPPASRPKRYARYLAKYLDRLALNEVLSEEDLQRAAQAASKLPEDMRAAQNQAAMQEVIQTVEHETIEPLLKVLDERADKTIRAAVRDIMIAVTLSPYHSVDLMVVIYRNLGMVGKLVGVYRSRPRLKESLAIVYDTLRVVATVNFVNLGSRLIENVSTSLPGMIPGIGRIVDDCAEGLAAGLLTSLTGHAAQDRCRAFRGWNVAHARTHIGTHMKTFSTDVGKMFFKDVVPLIKIPGGIALEKWRQMIESVRKGFNDTIAAFQNFVRHRSQ
ncbi:MAG: DUF697 domain-containing protein [Sedimentisphaerales bacterium]|nr:DUF697 domain-containing protein [Sedimentisphaerales bacterium]